MGKYIILPNGRETNFTMVELACSHCGQFNFHPGVLDILQNAREDLNESMNITSGCRCFIHNAAVGGVGGSTHISDKPAYANLGQLGTLAVDIHTPSGSYRGRLMAVLWKYKFTLGINFVKNFVHGDLRTLVNLEQTTFSY